MLNITLKPSQWKSDYIKRLTLFMYNITLKPSQCKGVAISCAAIFNAFPTDKGMCCSFNMKSAEDIFSGKSFPSLIKSLQETDNSNSFEESELPNYFVQNKEPTTASGRNKGLFLMLDAHTDLQVTFNNFFFILKL